ncbi:MAG: hypothetical protein K0Q49_1722 [Haloplasmataceae bacterium]|jgi:hypothetical protein|nr:hypothetical protein [Haloplasmataceae bacterium]
MRFIFATSVVVQLFALVIILQTAGVIHFVPSKSATRGVCFFFAIYLTLNAILNASSKNCLA